MQFMNESLSKLVYDLRFTDNFKHTSKYFGKNPDLTVAKIIYLYSYICFLLEILEGRKDQEKNVCIMFYILQKKNISDKEYNHRKCVMNTLKIKNAKYNGLHIKKRGFVISKMSVKEKRLMKIINLIQFIVHLFQSYHMIQC